MVIGPAAGYGVWANAPATEANAPINARTMSTVVTRAATRRRGGSGWLRNAFTRSTARSSSM